MRFTPSPRNLFSLALFTPNSLCSPPFFCPSTFEFQLQAQRSVSFRNDEGRPKLRVMCSVFLQRRQSSSRLQRLHRRGLQHRHRTPNFSVGRSHRRRHFCRRGPRFKDSTQLLDCVRWRNHSLLGLCHSRMHQETRPSLSYFLHGNNVFSLQLTNIILVTIMNFFLVAFFYLFQFFLIILGDTFSAIPARRKQRKDT